MSRHKKFKKNNGGVSPYMLWILCAPLMGHSISIDPRKKREYLILTKEKKEIWVQANAVNNLINSGFLEVEDNKISVTSKGFEKAHDRLKLSSITPKDTKKEKEYALTT